MQPKSDAQLLREYADYGSEPAFTELVQRYTNLVYSAALRQVETPAVAAEIAQGVFIGLARGGAGLMVKLADDASLAGWLCRSARNLSLNHRRDEFRRQTRERMAMEQFAPTLGEACDWEQLRRVLDDALFELDEDDYDAIVLRFFQNSDFRAVGVALGVSDDTAQKRVSRALDKLRGILGRHGITKPAAALTAAISANAVQAAPAGLAAGISAAALSSGALGVTTATIATKTIIMTTVQKTIIAATVAVLAGAGVYEVKQATRMRAQNQSLQQQEAAGAAEIGQLRMDRDNAANRAAALAEQLAQAKNDGDEVLKLRGQIGVLRQQLEVAQAAQPASSRVGVHPATAAAASDSGMASQLVQAIEQGDSTALQKLGDLAKARSDFYRTNSAGLQGDEDAAAWSTAFGELNSAFDSLANDATNGNSYARQAIDNALRMNSLRGMAVDALGKLAGSGDATALALLLDPEKNGLLLSSTVGALKPAADNGNQQAIDTLAGILADETKKPLWLMASQGLQGAAAEGNATAIQALKTTRTVE